MWEKLPMSLGAFYVWSTRRSELEAGIRNMDERFKESEGSEPKP